MILKELRDRGMKEREYLKDKDIIEKEIIKAKEYHR